MSVTIDTNVENSHQAFTINLYMKPSFLPPDDLPSLESSTELQWEFDKVVKNSFYKSCDRITQKLLSRCGWDLNTDIQGLTLVLICPNKGINWHILCQLDQLADYLLEWPGIAKIRVYPPPGTGSAMEVLATNPFIRQNS